MSYIYYESSWNGMKRICLLLYLLIIVGLCACDKNYPEYILHVERIMNQSPDSVLEILNSVKGEIEQESLSTRRYYNLLLAQAYERCDILDSCDALLPDVIRYYEEENEPDKLMKAYYLMGQLYIDLEVKGSNTALLYSYRALEQSGKMKNTVQNKAFIGRIHAQLSNSFVCMNLFEEAVRECRTAYSCFQSGNDNWACIDALCGLAYVYYSQSRMDSALHYYRKAYGQMGSCGNIQKKKMDILQKMSMVYIQLGNHEKVREILREIINEKKKENKLNCNIEGNLLLDVGQKDSATVCFKRTLENENSVERKEACWNLYQIEKKDGAYQQALAYLEKYVVYSDSAYAQSNIKSLQRFKVLCDLHYTEEEKEGLRHENNQQRVWIICIMITLAVVIGIAIQNNLMKKEAARKQKELLESIHEKQYKKSRQCIEDNKQVITELEGKIDSILQEKDVISKELLLVQKEKLEQANQAIETAQKQQTLLEEALRKSDIYAYCYRAIEDSSITLTGIDWKRLEQTVNDTYGDFTNRLFVLHPSITSMELHVCLLLKIRLPISTISQLVCRTQSAVSMSRKQLYKKIFHEDGIPSKLDEFILAF